MDIAIKSLLFFFFVVIYILRTLHFTHMFQLNSYKNKVQFKWLIKNKITFLKTTGLLLFPLLFSFVSDNIIYDTSLLIIFAAVAFLNIPRKAKKPLAFTKRVIRLLITNTVFMVGEIALLSIFVASIQWRFCLCALFLVISPFSLLVCNYINMPVEKAINRHYINDARRIISNHKSLITIGVTGSYGKTSVKYMLGTLLGAKYNVIITPESYNTPLGITRVIRGSLRATHDIFVCEMGAKNVGDIKEICDIVHPKHAIITSVGPQHLESFKTLDNVLNTKFELADSLPASGKLFLNGNDNNIKSKSKCYPNISYGFSDNCDYYAHGIKVSSLGTTFSIKHGDDSVEYTTTLIGKHNVLNLVGAIAVCCELGIDLAKLPPYVKKIKPIEHRLQLSKRGNITIIDDAYNSNPSGVAAALEALSLFNNKKIIITPGMIELGSVQFEENYKFGVNISSVCDYTVLVGKKQTEPIYKGLIDSGYDPSQIFIANDLKEAAGKAYGMFPNEEKTILFENDLPDNY